MKKIILGLLFSSMLITTSPTISANEIDTIKTEITNLEKSVSENEALFLLSDVEKVLTEEVKVLKSDLNTLKNKDKINSKIIELKNKQKLLEKILKADSEEMVKSNEYLNYTKEIKELNSKLKTQTKLTEKELSEKLIEKNKELYKVSGLIKSLEPTSEKRKAKLTSDKEKLTELKTKLKDLETKPVTPETATEVIERTQSVPQRNTTETTQTPPAIDSTQAIGNPNTDFNGAVDQAFLNSLNLNIDREGLTEWAHIIKNLIQYKFGIEDFSLLRPGEEEHGTGRAIDFMTYNDLEKGDKIVEYLINNHESMKVKWIIWKQQIWIPGYGWSWMEDRGSITQNHYDHVHLFLYE